MSVAQLVFFAIAGGAVAGGLGVVLARSTVYAALFLILSLLSVAGFYLLLASEFLALVQVLIYGGAVTVLFLFALLLTRVQDVQGALDGPQKPVAALVAAALLAVLMVVFKETAWPGDTGAVAVISFEAVGDQLFRRWAVPFEVASLVLLVALVGAIVLGRHEESE